MAYEDTGRGPKPKIDYWLTQDGLTLLTGWARQGLSNAQIAKNMGVGESTFYEWKAKHSDILEAIQKGKEVVDFEVENALLKRALGYTAEETKTYMKDDGEGKKTKHVEKTNKHIASDATSMIFWLKNRQPQSWRDRKETELSGQVDTTNAFRDLTTEELRALAKKNKDDETE